MSTAIHDLRPEPKFERAQEAQRGVMVRLKAIMEAEVTPVMGPDELEILALQFQLAAANLRIAARELRECEEERRRLAAYRELHERRIEWVPEEVPAEDAEETESQGAR